MARTKNAGKSPERRAEIIAALNRCILKQGYLNTSVRDIAREANVQSGVIHYYFESKEEILEKLMESIIDGYQQEAFLALSKKRKGKTPREKLSLVVEFLFLKLAREKDTNRMFLEFWNLSQHDEKLRGLLKALYKTYRAEISRYIAECLEALNIEYENIDSMAALLVGASEGIGMQLIIDPKGISVPKISKVADQLISALIGPDICRQ